MVVGDTTLWEARCWRREGPDAADDAETIGWGTTDIGRAKDELGADDGLDIGEGLVWRDGPKFGSIDGIWRLADVEGAITNFMESITWRKTVL